ncbi:MAG: ABC transporter ATP-binding protein [Saprospiraceae bacterium]
MKTYAITANNISVWRGNNIILDNVSIRLKAGEVVSIIGKSGSGKSTLLGALAGFIETKGTIELNGKVGYCFQSNSLYRFMTVEQNIAFGLDELPADQRQEKVQYILSKIGLNALGNRYPDELSGGQVQRVALGRAIAYNPQVLLLDEPFSALDLFTRDQMVLWVSDLIREMNIATVLVTHYLDEALLLSDKVFVLKNNCIQEELVVPFIKYGRDVDIRFTEKFQEAKMKLQNVLNS